MFHIKFFKYLDLLLVTLVVATVNSQVLNETLPAETEPALKDIPPEASSRQTSASHFYIARIDNTSGIGRKTCSAIIINNEFVLTAARCIDRVDPKFLKVRAGVTDLLGTTGTTHSVVGYRVHENYISTGITQNNIAVVKVTPAFVFNAQIGLISYNNRGVVGSGISVLVRSWQVNEYLSTVLPQSDQTQTTETISNAECRKSYAQLSDSQMCTRRLPFTGICRFDEGGPVTNLSGTWLMAINTVTNIGCSIKGLPNVHTRTSSYVDWIKSKLTELA